MTLYVLPAHEAQHQPHCQILENTITKVKSQALKVSDKRSGMHLLEGQSPTELRGSLTALRNNPPIFLCASASCLFTAFDHRKERRARSEGDDSSRDEAVLEAKLKHPRRYTTQKMRDSQVKVNRNGLTRN
jgi:hypothetical protein